jgi:hypothetical protein
MYIHRIFIVLLGFLFLMGLCSADPLPDQSSSLSSSATWIVVNHPSTITIVAHNTTSGSLAGATVNLAFDNPTLGSLVMTSPTTDASGIATGTFTAGTKSGAVNITATISKDGYSVTKTITQYIDHDVPYKVQFDYDGEVTVDTDTPFSMSFADYWGNPIDNKNPAATHTVSLHIGSVNNTAAFDNGGTFVQDINTNTDATGKASVIVRTSISGGENIIWMKAFGNIGDQYKSIISVTDAVPFSITQDVSPSPAMQPCDGAADHTFSFIYTLYDKHGNIAENQSVLLHTSWEGDKDTTFTSNKVGQVWLIYGPHQTAANISITATSLTNASVTATTFVDFYSTAPVNMQLTASPQTMGSLDAGSSLRANVSAEVTDIMGNPVSNESVVFTIGTPWYDGTYNVTAGPVWESTHSATVTGITNEDGFATVKFMPGAFSRNKSDFNYNQQATGHVTVTAKWVNANGTAVIQNLQLNWKNYPYLSVDTSVNPLTIGVNGTVDLTIKLKGDGWALQPSPIDVILCTDRSGSMMRDNPDRMVSIMDAEKTFIDHLSFPEDHMGEVSFGEKGSVQAKTYTSSDGTTMGPGKDTDTKDDVTYVAAHYPGNPSLGGGRQYYSDYAKLDLPLSPSQSTLQNTITSTIPYGGTPLRQGIYLAIKEIIANSTRSNAVKSVVVLSDGDYNYYGDPLARGSGSSCSGGWNSPSDYTDLTKDYCFYNDLSSSNQNMSVYAMSKGIKIYTIAYGSDISSGGQTTLKTLAESTGGKYYTASATDIASVYTAIAGDLQEQAGVNTTMQVVFDSVNVSGVNLPGEDVYQYVYDPSASTKITWQDGNSNVTDQTSDWNDDHNLNFNIGTITLNQVWQADMRFRLLKPGNVEVFSGSSVIFNNGTDRMDLPTKYVNVIPNLTNPGWSMQAIRLTDLSANTGGGKIVDTLTVTWNLTYPGNITKSATEQVFWSNDNKQSWHQFDTKSGIAPCVNSPQDSTLDIRNLPAGTYWIRVKASADDAVGDESITATGIDVGMAGKSYIKLE